MGSEIEPFQPAELWGDERETYDRLDGETREEFGWFRAYCLLGRKRTYKEVSAFQEVPRERIQLTGGRHSWVVRARAYDEWQDALKLAEIEARQIETRSRHMEMLEQMREKTEAAINLVDPFRMNPRDIPGWVEVLVKYQRLTVGLGDAPKKIEITGKDGAPIEMVTNMSREERRAMLAEIQQQITQRMAAIEALEVVDGEVVEDDPQ